MIELAVILTFVLFSILIAFQAFEYVSSEYYEIIIILLMCIYY